MSPLALLLGMAAGLYALRLAGFTLGHRLPPAVLSALRFTPVAVLTALVVSGLAGRADELTPRLAAAVAGGLIAYRTRQLWACIAAGLAIYWLLRPLVSLAGLAP